jgi:TolB-like protein
MKTKLIFALTLVTVLSLGCATAKKPQPVTKNNPVVKYEAQKEPADMIADVIISNISKLTNKKVAVADFTDIYGNEIEEGKLLAEQVTTKLSQNPSLVVVERKQLQKVLSEQKLELSGATESDNQNIGKLLNVDAIVSGTIAHLSDYEEINARMIDVKTGQIYCAVNPRKKLAERRQEFESLTPEIRNKLYKEFQGSEGALNTLRVQNRKELIALRENDPEAFRETLITIKEAESLKQDKPRLFLMLSEPKDSRKLEFFKKRNPGIYQRVIVLRNKLEAVYKNAPAYKEIMMFERNKMIKNAPIELENER